MKMDKKIVSLQSRIRDLFLKLAQSLISRLASLMKCVPHQERNTLAPDGKVAKQLLAAKNAYECVVR